MAAEVAVDHRVLMVPLDAIRECSLFAEGQPRTAYLDEGMRELTDSILQNGVRQPLLVRPIGPNEYEVLGGHRRRRAAIEARLEAVPCVVEDLGDDEARLLVVLDNLNREDFLPWEEGRGYKTLMDGGLSVAGIAQKTGRAVATIQDRIALAGVSEAMQSAYIDKRLTLYALQELAALPNRMMSPKSCPTCKGVNAEDAQKCGACGADLSGIMAFPAGNPQDAGTRLVLVRGGSNGVVAEVLKAVRASYGLGQQVVQTSLGLNDLQIEQAAVEVKHEWELMLAKVARAVEGLADQRKRKRLLEATQTQRAGILQQITAARAALNAIETVLQQDGAGQAGLTLV